MLKCRCRLTYTDGVIGVKCGKITLKFVNNDWIDSETGEVYTAVINYRNGKIVGFIPMPANNEKFVYVYKRNLYK